MPVQSAAIATPTVTPAATGAGASASTSINAGLLAVTAPIYDPSSQILTVGAGKQYATLAAAIAAAHDGSVILVNAGTYTNDFATINTKITIIGVGGMVNLVATVPPPNSKGILTVDNDVTIRNVSFSGSAISDADGGNGAGIRYEGGVMVLQNCAFTNNQNGVLGAAVIPALTNNTITIDHSVFNGNGSGTGYTHNVYIGTGVSQLTFTNNISQNAIVGHELKSRAVVNDIENNVFSDGPTGTASYAIDLPNGGQAVIANNVIEKGPNAENNAMVHFGGEGVPYSGSSLTIMNNTFVNDKGAATVAVVNQTAVSATISANNFGTITAANIASGPATLTGNIMGTGTLLSNSVLTGVLPGSTLTITDSAPHSVVLDGTPLLAVLGGTGALTVMAKAGHVTAIGGAGGMKYSESATSGGNQLTTAVGSTNTLLLSGVGGDTLDSEGTDTLVAGIGNLVAKIGGTATITDGVGNNQYSISGGATIKATGGNPILSVGAQAAAAITGAVGYLQILNNGGNASFDVVQGGANIAASITGGSVDARVYGGQSTINTAAGTAGTILRLGAGAITVASVGTDTIYAGSGNDTIIVSGAAKVYAGTGSLSVFGRGTAGASVYGNGGTVTLDGDTGNLTYYGGAAANTVISKLSKDTLIGGAGLMTVVGGSRETIIGGSGGVNITSPDGGGANTITTAAGSINSIQLTAASSVDSWGTDTILGGTGNATFWLHGDATLTGSTGNDTITVSGNARILGRGRDAITVTAGATATITSGASETISETNATVNLTAGAASVVVTGGVATINSTATGPITVSTSGKSPATITAGGGTVNVTTLGGDLIHAGSGPNTVTVKGANAQIWGGAGALTVHNQDLVSGDKVILTGGTGALTYDQTNATLQFIGGVGDANISGAAGALNLTGGSGKLTATGGTKGFAFTGGTGAAALTLTGNGGVITFGAGATAVKEAGFGSGVTYNFVAGHGGGTDTITGFRSGVDKLLLQGGVAVQSVGVSGGDANVRLTDGTSLRLVGVTKTTNLFG